MSLFARMRERVRRRPLAAFVFLAYGFSWLLARPYYWLHDALGITSPQDFLDDLAAGGSKWGLYLLVSTVFMAGPTFAAVVVSVVQSGGRGLERLRQRVLRWRVSPLWYVVALLLPVLVTLIWKIGVPTLLGIPFVAKAGTYSLVVLASLLPLSFFGSLAEEVGWRGYALPTLQARFNPVISSLLLGGIHWAWHLPLWVALPAWPLHLLRVVLLTFIFTWIYNHTRSVLLTALFHAAYASVGLVDRSSWGAGSASMVALIVVMSVVVAVILIADPLFRSSFRRADG